jgi:hypothetical protein
LDGEIYQQIVERAKRQGFDIGKLLKTPQTEHPSA